MENTEPPLKMVPLPHHPKCVTEHQGRVDKPGTSTWLGSWPSQLYIWRRTCEQYRKPENPILVMLYSGMILPLFWGLIARIKIYFRNHSWISWDFIGFHKTPNGNNPQYLEDFIPGFLQHCSCGLLRSTDHLKKKLLYRIFRSSSTIIYSYHHLLPSGPNGDGSRHIKTYPTPICSSVFLYFCGERNVHKNQLFWREKKGDSIAESGRFAIAIPNDTSLKTLMMGRLIGDVYYPFIGYFNIWGGSGIRYFFACFWDLTWYYTSSND